MLFSCNIPVVCILKQLICIKNNYFIELIYLIVFCIIKLIFREIDMVTSNKPKKTLKVGVKQVISSVKRLDETTIRNGIIALESTGSPKAPMYDIDQVKSKFHLTDDEYNNLHSLATKPRVRKAKANTNDSNKLVSLATDLATKSSKIEAINKDLDRLTSERDTLQREVDEILSKLTIK